MPYLICNECEIYYEIYPDSNHSPPKTCEKCGKELDYYENFDDYYKKENFDLDGYENEINFNTYSKYAKITTAGFILSVIGLFVFVLAYVSPFFLIYQNTNNLLSLSLQMISLYILAVFIMAGGVFTYLYGKRNGKIRRTRIKSENKGIKTVNKNPNVNFFEDLPAGYFILNKVKIPGKKIKINYIVIGPTGIFLIHIHNLRGHYIINENEWIDNIGKLSSKTVINPQLVKLNAIEIKRFLKSKNLDIDYVKISSIVAFPNNNFTLRKMPKTYKVMNTQRLSNFIVNSKIKMDLDTVTEAVVLLEHHCGNITRS